jgi:hypothetical protein
MTRSRSRKTPAVPVGAHADLATLAFTAPFVIASRMTGMWLNVLSPTAKGDRENSMMVNEKVLAGFDSIAAMNLSIAKQMTDAAMAPLSGMTPRQFDPQLVFAASLRPYAKRVTSNARRLSRKS